MSKHDHGSEITLPEEGHDPKVMEGATRSSHWVIPGRLCVEHSRTTSKEFKIFSLLELRHLCVWLEKSQQSTMKTTNSPKLVREILDGKKKDRVPQTNVQFVHFRITDGSIPDDSPGSVAFVDELTKRVRRGEVLYIHCASGHGRTGMMVIRLLNSLFDLSTEKSQDLLYLTHSEGRRSCKWNERWGPKSEM
eukprot:TRINITY_DN16269_c0_g1_i1.p1 TRINITY_DN16269_c0_g1~~TRINITY_DN16269_c0_g1_i1.p1  ORF type:complete len:192 (+),score=22.01 TRINITY_DN16269_c0_g1_i1:409-984(+)